MFRRILVPLDVARKNQLALSAAAEMARLHRGEILLLHVIERIELLPDDEMKAFYHRLEQGAECELALAAASLAERGVAATTQILFGHRAEVVVRFAVESQVNLIVMRSHRYEAQSGSFPVGTLSHQVAALAQCAVLLVK